MEKQFNLMEEREKWLHKWLRKPLTARALGELKITDDKFIELLKEEGFIIKDDESELFCIQLKRFNELAGGESN